MSAVDSRTPREGTTPAVQPAPATGLDCDLGFMLGAVFRSYVRATQAVVADIPGGPRGFQVLSAAADGSSGGQGALAQRLGIDKTVMTYLVDDLETAGLVERRRDPADRRNKRIVATDGGATTARDLRERIQRAEDHVLGALPPEERTAFRAMLQRLTAGSDVSREGSDACSMVEELTGDRSAC